MNGIILRYHEEFQLHEFNVVISANESLMEKYRVNTKGLDR